jgi:hypothetical protein
MSGEMKLNPSDMPKEVAIDFLWGEQYKDKIQSVVIQYLPEIMLHLRGWRDATAEEDKFQATDFVLPRLSIASRVRRPWQHYRDLTLRKDRPSGNPQERDKIAAGYGDIAAYGWTDFNNHMSEYVIVDFHTMRKTNIINEWDEVRENQDGSSTFCIWHLKTNDPRARSRLIDSGCVIVAKINGLDLATS